MNTTKGLFAERAISSPPVVVRAAHPGAVVGSINRTTATRNLARRLCHGASGDEAIELRNQIVLGNLGLVSFVLRAMKVSVPRHDDAFSEGVCGLIEAAGRFDPERGSGFASFALPRIRGRVASWLYRSTTLTGSENVGRRACLLRRNARDLPVDLQCSSEILAQRTGLPVRTVKRLACFVRSPLWLDGATTPAIPSEEPDPREVGTVGDQLIGLQAALSVLPIRLRKVVEETYGLEGCEDRPQRVIARDLGLTRQRVSQLLHEALGRLRQHLER